MKLIDRSPGAFLVIVGLVVYCVALVEAWVGLADSYVLMGGALVLIAITAGLACVFMVRLLDDGAEDGVATDEVVVEEAPVRAPLAHTPATPSVPRRPSAGRPAHVA